MYCIGVFAGEMHAELCYAECLLQKATLTFVQVRIAVCLSLYLSACLRFIDISYVTLFESPLKLQFLQRLLDVTHVNV